MAPTFLTAHDNIDRSSSIGSIAQDVVEVALESGYRVTVVAKWLAPELRSQVEWIEWRIPPRVHAYQWLSAHRSFRKAVGDRAFDVTHVHQVQLAAEADLWHCHFVSQAAKDAGSFGSLWPPARGQLRIQQEVVRVAEDRAIRRLSPSTLVLCVSDLVRRELDIIAGRQLPSVVAPQPAPEVRPITATERSAARERLLAEIDLRERLVIGYLGGTDPRKGGQDLAAALRGHDDTALIWAGPGADMPPPGFEGRCVALGRVDDVREVLAASDALAVPSRFDPNPMVCWQAASAGVPVLATPEVGSLADLARFGGAVEWAMGTPIAQAVTTLRSRHAELSEGALAAARALDRDRWAGELRRCWDELRARPGNRRPS